MQKSIRKCLPTAKATIITIVGSFVVGVINAGGFGSEALLIGLGLTVGILAAITYNNHDSAFFPALTQGPLRTEHRLFKSLEALTKAVEADSSIAPTNIVAVRADDARQLLDEITARPSSR